MPDNLSAPLCNCRIRKNMRSCVFVNGIFVWQGYFCPSCHTGVFSSKWQSWGYRFTRLLVTETEVMCRGGDDDTSEVLSADACAN